MDRSPFTCATHLGGLSGWVSGEGPRVLAIHGGPGMSYDYLDEALDESRQVPVATFNNAVFASTEHAGSRRRAVPQHRRSHGLSGPLWLDLRTRLPELESSLRSIKVPVGVLVGEQSPMPRSAGTDTVDRIPGAWLHVAPGAGHFVWHEAPGCLLAAMDRLVQR